MHQEILRRYDEVISTKASKINLLELEGNLHNQLHRINAIPFIEKKVEGIVKHVETMINENEQRFELINSSISLEISNAVKKAIK
jgi:hypothetical protein